MSKSIKFHYHRTESGLASMHPRAAGVEGGGGLSKVAAALTSLHTHTHTYYIKIHTHAKNSKTTSLLFLFNTYMISFQKSKFFGKV